MSAFLNFESLLRSQAATCIINELAELLSAVSIYENICRSKKLLSFSKFFWGHPTLFINVCFDYGFFLPTFTVCQFHLCSSMCCLSNMSTKSLLFHATMQLVFKKFVTANYFIVCFLAFTVIKFGHQDYLKKLDILSKPHIRNYEPNNPQCKLRMIAGLFIPK